MSEREHGTEITVDNGHSDSFRTSSFVHGYLYDTILAETMKGFFPILEPYTLQY